jgi:hypothetical protein
MGFSLQKEFVCSGGNLDGQGIAGIILLFKQNRFPFGVSGLPT